MHNENQTAQDELAWQAFRYIAGEMTREEHERFAECLAEDQAAREAVAAAVEISQAAAIALAAQPAASRRDVAHGQRRSVRVLWATLATAVCIAVVWGVSQMDVRSNSSNAQQTAALAAQWSEVREQSLAASLDEEFDEYTIFIEEVELPAEAPQWMLAAVEQQGADNMNEMPGEIEDHIEESREQ